MRFDAEKFLEDLTGRHARLYAQAIDDMLVAKAVGDKIEDRASRLRFENLTRETMGMAEILGASLILQDSAKVVVEERVEMQGDTARLTTFADEPSQTILPRVTFTEAVQDMVTRTPVTIRDVAQRSAQAISKLYGEGRVFAFAKSAENAVTERAKKLISDMLREGVPEVDAGRRVVRAVDEVRKRTKAWSEGYARMAFRTNVNTAVTAGRFRTLKDPAIRKVMPAVEFQDAGDSDTRHSHHLADGVIMAADDLRWNWLAPPLDYNCRCRVRGVSAPELRRRGRLDEQGNLIWQKVPAGAGPAPGFRTGGRPDLALSGLA